MSVYEKGLATILACNGLFALVSLPLVFRKVPRNGLYGYRTRATLLERLRVVRGQRVLRTAVPARERRDLPARRSFSTARCSLDPGTYLKVSVALLVAPALIAALLTSRYVRTLLDEQGGGQ